VAHNDDPGNDGAARVARMVERELRGWFKDFFAAAGLLTRIPFIRRSRFDDEIPADGLIGRAARAFPFVGLAIGLVAGLAYALFAAIGLPDVIAAIIALAVGALVTGALHEDGLADTADGFGGGQSRDDKLSIMRDSRIGAYGVIALVLVLGAKLGALVDLDHIGLVLASLMAAGATSRALLPAMMRWVEPARVDGLSVAAGRPPASAVFMGLGLALLLSLILLNWTGLIALIIATIGACGMAFLARRQIGGQTGDVLGATQQVAELLFLLTVAAIR